MDLITVIIVLLIVGICADGFRRVRKARKENLPLSRRAQELNSEDSVKVSSSEFPSGGARVLTRREAEEVENLNQDVKKNFETSKITVGAPKRAPEQASLNLEEVVPMLMDSLDPEDPMEVTVENEPALGDMRELESEAQAVVQECPSKDTSRKPEPELKSGEGGFTASEVLIVSIMAKPEERFQGPDLLQSLMEVHMKFGDMDIFHRYEEDDNSGKIYFSLANIVVPGTFNLAEMKVFSTPGVSLFLQLPLHPECESLKAFDIFVDTARSLATRLSGELKDENRSVMTSQTFEHYRQRVIEFERRQKLQYS